MDFKEIDNPDLRKRLKAVKRPYELYEFEELSDPELRKKLRSAQSPEDMFAISQEYGVELDDEQLEAVAGGTLWCSEHDDCSDFFYCDINGPL